MPPARHTRKLSEELHLLAEEFTLHSVELREVIALLQERAYTLLIIILALPFCAPITVPGLSTPFGLVIALLAAAAVAGRSPALPPRLLAARLPPRFFHSLLEATSRFIRFGERLVRPRGQWLTDTDRRVRLHSLIVLLGALVLLIPAPLPFSNTLPAWGIVLGTAGVMQRDGAAILLGHCFTLLGAAYFVLVAMFGVHLLDWLRAWLAGA